MKNIPGEKLNQAMSDLVKAFDRLFKRTKVKEIYWVFFERQK